MLYNCNKCKFQCWSIQILVNHKDTAHGIKPIKKEAEEE